jgi:sulfite exporter TauE/SafE
MSVALLITNAFLLGLAHAIEPDHVAAVSVFVARYPGRSRAVRFCVQWGIGHMLPLLASLGAIALVGTVLPAKAVAVAERVVGVVLVVLGVWLLRQVWSGRLHAHVHEHAGLTHSHLHAHRHGNVHAHPHAHAVVGVGILHGLAGSATVLVLAPVVAAPSLFVSGAYIVAFSAGVILAMVAYGWSTGTVIAHLSAHRARWLSITQAAVAICSITLGCGWML